MARLFISHSSRNNDKAIEVRDWLASNGFAYSGQSLTRVSSALTPSTAASAARGSAPCRTSALDQLVWPGGDP